MEQTESHSQSFIVKIWLEETIEEAGRATWRGHITHVPGGERRYVQNLTEIDRFIVQYLRLLGVSIKLDSRLCRYLNKIIHRDGHG